MRQKWCAFYFLLKSFRLFQKLHFFWATELHQSEKRRPAAAKNSYSLVLSWIGGVEAHFMLTFALMNSWIYAEAK